MGKNSKIEWTQHTFNIVIGCTEVSEGCAFCYARSMASFRGWAKWGSNERRHIMSDSYWKEPYKWDRKAHDVEVRERVFCSSLADVFEDHPDLVAQRSRLWPLIGQTPNLDWLLLTKRPQNMQRFVPAEWKTGWPFNTWAMTTAENQSRLDERWPILREIPAPVLGLSLEPLLSAIDLAEVFRTKPKNSQLWIIAGGESGAKAREAAEGWFLSLRDQCTDAGVPFLFKQWGARHDSVSGKRLSKKKAGRLLEGREWNGYPETVRIDPAPQPTRGEAVVAGRRVDEEVAQ